MLSINKPLLGHVGPVLGDGKGRTTTVWVIKCLG